MAQTSDNQECVCLKMKYEIAHKQKLQYGGLAPNGMACDYVQLPMYSLKNFVCILHLYTINVGKKNKTHTLCFYSP